PTPITPSFPTRRSSDLFYLAVLDDTVRMPDEGPSIGIVLCKSKDRTIVEYSLRESNKPIGVGSYRVVSVLPRELEGELPAPEQRSEEHTSELQSHLNLV